MTIAVFCNACGARFEGEDRFCIECGASRLVRRTDVSGSGRMTATEPIRPALTVADLQVALGLGRDAIRRMIRDGELPTSGRAGGTGTTYTVPAAAYDAWCLARGHQAAHRATTATTAERPHLIQPVRRGVA